MRKDRNLQKTLGVQCIIILLSMFMGIIIYIIYLDGRIYGYEERVTLRKIDSSIIGLEETENTISKASESIVGISKLKKTDTSVFMEDGIEKLGIGSGIIISSNGYILTNEHVAGEKYSTCYVTTDIGVSYKGKVMWEDSEIDLAIIKINAKDLKVAKMQKENNVKLGQRVFAIGNPIGFEFERTVTSGIVSGKRRTIKIKRSNGTYGYMENLIQTDATINEGNSGGALIDEEGNVLRYNICKSS